MLAACESSGSGVWVGYNSALNVKDKVCRGERWIECQICDMVGPDNCIMPDHCTEKGSHNHNCIEYGPTPAVDGNEFVVISDDISDKSNGFTAMEWNVLLVGLLLCALMGYVL